MSKHIELIKKVKKLAEKGVAGEKTNAERMLKKLMIEHGITEKDLESYEVKNRLMVYKKKHESISVQSVLFVMGKDVIMYNYPKKRNSFIFKATDAEYIEIGLVVDFYSKKFDEEYDVFLSAFIQRNKLLPKDGGSADHKPGSEEQKKSGKVLKMMNSMDKHSMHKRLENNAG